MAKGIESTLNACPCPRPALGSGRGAGLPAENVEEPEVMAQTTVPVYLTGKLGSMVYTKNRPGAAVRTLVTPANPVILLLSLLRKFRKLSP